MASKSLSLPTILLLSLLLCSALATPCDQPKTKPAPSVPKKKPAIPKIIRPPAASSPAVQSSYCPKDTLKLGVCADILGIGSTVIGSPVSNNCCALLSGLTDVEAAACLCTAIKANVLGINLNIPVSISLLISSCQKTLPDGYQCKWSKFGFCLMGFLVLVVI